MSEIVSRRIGNVIIFGNTIGLTLKEEIIDLGLDKGSQVKITVIENNGKKKIVIEKVE